MPEAESLMSIVCEESVRACRHRRMCACLGVGKTRVLVRVEVTEVTLSNDRSDGSGNGKASSRTGSLEKMGPSGTFFTRKAL